MTMRDLLVPGETETDASGESLSGPNRLRGKSGAEVIREIERFVSQWRTPEDVIRDHPDLRHELRYQLV